MKTFKEKITLILLLSMTLNLSAGTPPPPPGGGSNNQGNKLNGGGAPVGGGVFILIGLGVAYTGRKTYMLHDESKSHAKDNQ